MIEKLLCKLGLHNWAKKTYRDRRPDIVNQEGVETWLYLVGCERDGCVAERWQE